VIKSVKNINNYFLQILWVVKSSMIAWTRVACVPVIVKFEDHVC